MEVSISHTVGSQKSITMEIKKVNFGFGDVEINKTILGPPNNILKVIFEINCQFEFIDPLRFNIKTVNSRVISIDSKSGIDNN